MKSEEGVTCSVTSSQTLSASFLFRRRCPSFDSWQTSLQRHQLFQLQPPSVEDLTAYLSAHRQPFNRRSLKLRPVPPTGRLYSAHPTSGLIIRSTRRGAFGEAARAGKMSTAARRRLMRDFKRMQTDPPAGVSASPIADNVMTW